MPKKTDANHVEIMQALRAVGCSVFSTHEVGKGFPDIVVGYSGKTYLMEIKMPGAHLTKKEDEFFRTWKGMAVIVYSIENALKVIGYY